MFETEALQVICRLCEDCILHVLGRYFFYMFRQQGPGIFFAAVGDGISLRHQEGQWVKQGSMSTLG